MPTKGGLDVSSLLSFFKQTQSRQSLGMISLLFSAHFGTYTYIKPLLEQARFQSRQITLILLGYGLTSFLANFIASYFVTQNLRKTLLVAKLLMALPLVLLPFTTHSTPLLLILLTLVWGIAWGALPLCLSLWNRNTAQKDVEPAFALFTFTTQVSIAVGSGLAGVIMDHLGIHVTFWIGGALTTLSILLFSTIWSKR